MALSREDFKDVSKTLGRKTASVVSGVTNDAKNKAIHAKAKFPGWRKMTSSQRRNAKMDSIWEQARKHGAI